MDVDYVTNGLKGWPCMLVRLDPRDCLWSVGLFLCMLGQVVLHGRLVKYFHRKTMPSYQNLCSRIAVALVPKVEKIKLFQFRKLDNPRGC